MIGVLHDVFIGLLYLLGIAGTGLLTMVIILVIQGCVEYLKVKYPKKEHHD